MPQLYIIASAFDRSAVGVTDDGDEFRSRDFRGELQAAEDVLVDDVTGNAGGKDVTHPLVEHKLRRGARIKTCNHGSEGILTTTRIFNLARKIAMKHLAGHETLVTRFEQRQRLSGGYRGLILARPS